MQWDFRWGRITARSAELTLYVDATWLASTPHCPATGRTAVWCPWRRSGCADPVCGGPTRYCENALAKPVTMPSDAGAGDVQYGRDWVTFVCLPWPNHCCTPLIPSVRRMRTRSSPMFHPAQSERVQIPQNGICEVKKRLLDEFLKAIRDVTLLLSHQAEAVIEWDSEFSRFDVPLHLAQQKREAAKYALIAHIEGDSPRSSRC
jgi:hypothetical protein